MKIPSITTNKNDSTEYKVSDNNQETKSPSTTSRDLKTVTNHQDSNNVTYLTLEQDTLPFRKVVKITPKT